MTTEKLQKVLARAGVASRREIERWIEAGRVSIDGKKATLGDRVSGHEKIRVDGKLISVMPSEDLKTKVLIYNKPEGEICSADDPEGRETVFSHLPNLQQSRCLMIGSLDINTSGLLLFTNNGELAHRLMHPSYEIEREYAVRVKGDVDKAMLQRLCNGVELDDGIAKFNTIVDAGGEGLNHWYHVTLQEGRNREVRRLWESQNITVSRLMRVRYGIIALPRSLRRGRWEYLDKNAVVELENSVRLSSVDN
jgi:23S rRNA pseudouridine2605 synthase